MISKILLNNFPRIELSYEKNVYKKAQSADIYLSIPKGKKYFLWFTGFLEVNPTLLFSSN